MSDYAKKAAFIRGYISALSEELKNEKSFAITGKLLDIIEEMATAIDNLHVRIADVDDLFNAADDIFERLDELSDRVTDIELFGMDEDIDADDLDDDSDLSELDFDDEELEESDLFEIQCTECGDDFTIDYDDIMGGEAIRCPHCGARIELAIDFDDDDDKEWDF